MQIKSRMKKSLAGVALTTALFAVPSLALAALTIGSTSVTTDSVFSIQGGNVGVGSSSPTGKLTLEGSVSAASWGTSGIGLQAVAATYTDTSGSGAITSRVANSFAQPTFASSNPVTVGTAATLYVADAPAAGTNTTLTNSRSLWVAAGPSEFSGNLGVKTFTTASTDIQVGVRVIGLSTYSGRVFIQESGNDGPEAVEGIELQNVASGGGYGYKLYTNTTNDYFGIAARYNSASWTEYFTLKQQTGNIGIGTNNPSEKLDINSNNIRIRTAKTPSSAADTCDAGEISWDASYIYVCVATNTWKRSAIATW